jgi:hypothetical protein
MTSMRRGLVVVMVLVLAGSASAFDPERYAGTWTGTWKNKTFKVDGTMSATATTSAGGAFLAVDYTISSLFNCGPVVFTRVLQEGVDFTDAGLSFTATEPAWGGVTVTSTTKKKLDKVSMDGGTPCNTGIGSWKLRAKLKEDSLKGTMKIFFLPGSSPKKAKATFTATKQ